MVLRKRLLSCFYPEDRVYQVPKSENKPGINDTDDNRLVSGRN